MTVINAACLNLKSHIKNCWCWYHQPYQKNIIPEKYIAWNIVREFFVIVVVVLIRLRVWRGRNPAGSTKEKLLDEVSSLQISLF